MKQANNIVFLFLLLSLNCCCFIQAKLFVKESILKPKYSEKSKMQQLQRARMNGDQYHRVEALHKNWYSQALTSLLGVVGREIYAKLNRDNRRAFIKCLDAIEDDRDVESGAKCIVHALDNRITEYNQRSESSAPWPRNDAKEGVSTIPKEMKRIVLNLKPLKKEKLKLKNISDRKTNIKNINEIRKFTSKRLQKYGVKPSVVKVRRKRSRNIDDFESNSEIDSPISQSKRAPALRSAKIEQMPKGAIGTFARIFTNFIRTANNNNRVDTNNTQKLPMSTRPWQRTYESLTNLNSILAKSAQRRRYRSRMLDVVVDEGRALKSDDDYRLRYKRRRASVSQRFSGLMPDAMAPGGGMLPKLLPHVYGLADTVSAHTDQVNFRVLSPKFGSVIDAHPFNNTGHFLSPNILPFYNDTSGNALMPVPSLLKMAGIKEDDREELLELIMETSGARQIVEDAYQMISSKSEMSGLIGDINGVTDIVTQSFKGLKQSLNVRQRRDLSKRKFSFLTPQQLDVFYGKEGIYNSTKLPFNISMYGMLGEADRRRALIKTIRLLAEAKNEGEIDREELRESSRKGRDTETTEQIIFGHKPTEIGDISIYRLILLSPFAFSPDIYDPILSPNVGNPQILSPFVLGPNILSAGVWAVYVLTPYAISPNIANPWLMSPIILSPHVLSPDIISPTLLSGAILNPYVLSPAIFTESALAIDILAPSVLS